MIDDHGPKRPFFVTHLAAKYAVIPLDPLSNGTVSGDFGWGPMTGISAGLVIGDSDTPAESWQAITPYGFAFTDGEAIESRYRRIKLSAKADVTVRTGFVVGAVIGWGVEVLGLTPNAILFPVLTPAFRLIACSVRPHGAQHGHLC